MTIIYVFGTNKHVTICLRIGRISSHLKKNHIFSIFDLFIIKCQIFSMAMVLNNVFPISHTNLLFPYDVSLEYMT